MVFIQREGAKECHWEGYIVEERGGGARVLPGVGSSEPYLEQAGWEEHPGRVMSRTISKLFQNDFILYLNSLLNCILIF